MIASVIRLAGKVVSEMTRNVLGGTQLNSDNGHSLVGCVE